MARPKANLVVLDPGSGKARPGAYVTLYLANTLTKAALYADDDVSTLPNPVQANGLGQIAARVEPGLYDISMTWDGAQPTVVEDVNVLPTEIVITTPGDVIVGDAQGHASRLAVGTNGQVFLVINGMPQWGTLGAGSGLPTGSPGSILSYGPTGAISSILPGVQDQALVMAGGQPTWASILAPGSTLPINQPGDLVVGAVSTGAPARLPRGNAGEVLTAQADRVIWANPSSSSAGRGEVTLGLYAYGPPGGTVALLGEKGNQIWIDGAMRTLPNEGATLLPTGLTADTLYFVYAAWVSNAIVLEASTTGWQSPSGFAYKNGDPSRTLVGMVRPILSGGTVQFVNSPRQRFVLQYFRTKPIFATACLTAPRVIPSSTTAVEVHPEIAIEFLSWGFAVDKIDLTGEAIISQGGLLLSTAIVLDGVGKQGLAISTNEVNPVWQNIACGHTDYLAEGYHRATLHAWTNGAAGDTTFWGDAAQLFGCRLTAYIQG
jgi:hypothetical protein